MPNYSLIVDSTYNPLTYAEISAPVKEAAAFHQALQDKYDEQAMNAAIYDRYIGDDNPEARAMYDEYMASLNSAADALMKHGAWGQRDIFSNVRKGFAQKMLPIKMAYEMGDKEAQQQLADLRQNPLLVFDRDATKSNIDYYLKNPKGGYRTVNPAHTASYISTKSKAFAERIKSDPEFRASLESMGENTGYLLGVIDNGLNPETALEWRKDPILRGIMKEALSATAQGMQMDMNGYGIDAGGWTADQVNRVIDFGSQGFVAGVGKTQAQFLQDLGQMHEWDLDKIRAQQAANNSYGDSGTDLSAYLLPNDNHWAIDDSMTNIGEIHDVEDNAKALGFDVDKKGHVVSVPKKLSAAMFDKAGNLVPVTALKRNHAAGTLVGDIYDRTLGHNPYYIIQDLAKENGWEYDKASDSYKVNGHKVTSEDVKDALNDSINHQTASYHNMQDLSLSGYNDAFKGVHVYPVSSFNKDRTYKVDEDHPVPISSVLSDKDITSANVGLDMTSTNNGLMLKVSRGGKFSYYHIAADAINSSNIKAAAVAATQAASLRNDERKKRKLSNEEWDAVIKSGYLTEENKEMFKRQIEYVEAVKQLQQAIGSENTVSSVNITNS